MSDYLKKKKRSDNKSFQSKSNGGDNLKKGFNVKLNKMKHDREESINFDSSNINAASERISEDLIKIGKFWDGKTLIEPKNTIGNLSFIEKETQGSSFTLSQVGDSLHILNTEDLSLVDKITQNEESIVTYAFNNNPKRNEVICAMSNSLIKVFDLNNLKTCKKVWKLNKESAKIMKVDSSFKFLAIATSLNKILIYDTETYKLLNTFSGHTGYIYDIQFNPDKEKFMIYSGSEDGSIKIWDIILNKCVGTLIGHTTAVRYITLTNDGKSLISVTANSNIYIWKLSNKSEDSTLIRSFPFHKEISSIIYFTRSKVTKGTREIVPSLLLGCEDGTICEVNLKSGNSNTSGQTVKYSEQPIVQIYYSISFKRLYMLTADQMIIDLSLDLVNADVSNATLVKMYPGYCQELLDVKLLPSVNHNLNFLFSSNDNSLKYYQQETESSGQTLIKAFEGHEDFIMNIEVKDNFISTSSKDRTIRIWKYTSVDEEFECKCIAILKGHSEAVNSSALMVKHDVRRVVSCGKDMSVKIWDFASAENNSKENPLVIKQSIHSEIAHSEEVNLVKVSPNEKLIASGAYDKTIKIFSNDLKLLGTITGHKRAITDLSFSKYAKLLASSSTDKMIKIWNLNDYSCINTFEGHLAAALKVQWVYFGTHLISAGADGLVKLWNLKTSECLNTLSAHEGKIWALDVNTDNNDTSDIKERTKTCQFITGGTDSRIVLWTDVTAQKETEVLHKEEETILKKEKLRILNDDKQYYDAMKLALDLNHRNDFMNILKNFINDNLKSDNGQTEKNSPINIIINNRKALGEEESKKDVSSTFKENLSKILKDVELRKIMKSNIHKILEITRDNNLRSSNFLYVQILLKLILISTNYEFFFNNNEVALGKKNKKLKKERKDIDYIENFTIIKSYSDKHLERINREMTKSYLVDFVLEKMKII